MNKQARNLEETGNRPHGAKMTIFLVDDEPLVRKALSRVLKGDGHEVFEFKDPEEAMQALDTCRPDCIISDYYMPGTNGLTFLETVRSRYPGIPRVMLTGGLLDQQVLDALQEELIHVLLQKPWHVSSIRKVIEHAWAGDKKVFIGKDPVIQSTGKPDLSHSSKLAGIAAQEIRSTVLMVIEDGEVRSRIEAQLTQLGYRVLSCTEPGEASELMRAEEPQVILVDVFLSDCEGFSLIESVRELSTYVPIVATAVENRNDLVVDALRSGATCFLAWPFGSDTLGSTIQRCLRMENLFLGESRRSDLSALLQIQHAISSGIPEHQMLDLLLQEMIRQTSADRGTIMLLEKDERNLRIAASYGLSSDVVRQERIPVGDQVSGWVVMHNQPRMVFGNAGGNSRRDGKEKNASVGLCLPMRGRDKVLGALCLTRIEGTAPFTRDSIDLGILLGSEVAQAIERNADEAKQLNLERNLARHDKLLTIGELASGIAHEINNPLGYVNSNVDTLKNYLDGIIPVLEKLVPGNGGPDFDGALAAMQAINLDYIAADLPECIEETREGIGRVLTIISDLKALAREDSVEMDTLDIHKVLEGAVNIVWNQIKHKAQLVREYTDAPAIACYPSQLGQVFLNLLHNAVQAIESNGRIVLRTGKRNGFVFVEVEDNGSGMDKEVARQVFEPFYTTKPRGIGTGMGLNIARKIIERHHGRISLQSEKGKGTTFRVELPKDGNNGVNKENGDEDSSPRG